MQRIVSVVDFAKKPRNYVALALSKRGGKGPHSKSTKSKRRLSKVKLKEEDHGNEK